MSGLSKQDQFVLAAMQGLCAAVDYGNGNTLIDVDAIASDALAVASRTLEFLALEKNTTPSSE
jgi:hypothetical protein